jgi:hypothetical protein
VLQDHALAEFRRDPLKVERVQRQAAFVGFARRGDNPEGEMVRRTGHFFFAGIGFALVLSSELAGAEAALLSARFSLMDLPDFLDAA